MAPIRRSRRGRSRWPRVQYLRQAGNLEETIAGEPVRHVYDSYCPFCATNIRAVGPRRLVRCPNSNLCGKPLPIDDNCCPNCTHYIRANDNFCRICRTNLRSVVRGRGGLYQQLNRVPSPLRNTSPPRPEPQPQNEGEIETDEDQNDNEDDEVGHVVEVNGVGQGGFLRVVAIDD